MGSHASSTLAQAPVELGADLGVPRRGRRRQRPHHQHGGLGQGGEPVAQEVAQPALDQVAGHRGSDRLRHDQPGPWSTVGRVERSLEQVHDEQWSADTLSTADDLTELAG